MTRRFFVELFLFLSLCVAVSLSPPLGEERGHLVWEGCDDNQIPGAGHRRSSAPRAGVARRHNEIFAVVAVAWVSWGCQFLRPFPPQEPFSVCSAALILRRSFVNGSGGGGANVSYADLCLKCQIFLGICTRQVRAPDTSKGDANRDG